MTKERALSLARSLKYGVLLKPTDPTPTEKEAVEILKEELRTCGFNWLTGRYALDALTIKERKSNGKKSNT